MKFATTTTSSVVVAAFLGAFAGFFLAATPVVADEATARIHVHCDKVRHHTYTKDEKEFFAEAVMLSYNELHMLEDDGDMYVSGMKWDDDKNADLDKKDLALLESFDDKESLDEKEEPAEGDLGYYRYWDSDWWYFSSWRCGNLCYNGLDDCDWQYDGLDWICTRRKLLAEHEVIIGKKKHHKTGAQKWGAILEKKLNDSPFKKLSKATNCYVGMKLEDKKEELGSVDAEQMVEASTPIAVNLECKGMDLKHGLSTVEQKFSAQTLMDTYNALTGNDLKLINVNDDGVFIGECKTCNDDGELDFAIVAARSNLRQQYVNKIQEPEENMKKWASMFEKAVVDGPYSALYGIQECAITVSSSSMESKNGVAPA